MLVPQIIAKKRDHGELGADEIRFMVEGLASGEIPDYQVAAWAMAILCRGMTAKETACLTQCMLESGVKLQRSSERMRVDKHSTGGLGDKVSLVLAPVLACFDLEVPMLSGRGLGITGGTLDKLESYAGFRCDLSEQEIEKQVSKIGCVITGTTQNVAPADRKLYALRDVTGTVPSVSLITASILSKKLAENLDGLVLDVKVGSGSFMKSMEEARQLATSLTSTSALMGLKATAVISDMNQPLGQMIGNACEANEAVEVLRGGGPDDTRTLTVQLAARLLVSTNVIETQADAAAQVEAELENGRALERFVRMIELQGGTFTEHLTLAESHQILAQTKGFLHSVDGEQLGQAVIELGGGRRIQGATINHQVGVKLLKKLGERIEQGEPLAEVYCSKDEASSVAGCQRVSDALKVSEDESTIVSPPLIHELAT